jgi:hypothetical protein
MANNLFATKNNNPTTSGGSASQKCQEIFAGIDKANQAAIERGSGKELVLVLGNTGSGKSTFVNYLVGKKMREEKVPKSLGMGFVCDDPVMEIGPTSRTATARAFWTIEVSCLTSRICMPSPEWLSYQHASKGS